MNTVKTPATRSAAGPASGQTVYIGGASGFWGDSQLAVPQLLQAPRLDYLVFDYLAETTMSVLQRARMRHPELGYATDFVETAIRPNLRTLLARGIRVVSNAGGLNPAQCREAILTLAREQGLAPRIAIVTGDDVLSQSALFSTTPEAAPGVANLPPLLSANAYLGAMPIAEALRAGADIVITGRCVDSASVLGIAAHCFGWSFDDWDRLAQASLAGHLIECGAQATGGLFTDWESVPDWANIGYPIIEMQADASFVLTKPDHTGGRVDRAVAAEQLLYEIGDPAAYALPDVVCDFTQVQLQDDGPQRVRVSGARGCPPSAHYKVTATYPQGYQIAIMMAIRGQRAKAKAERTAQALLTRTRAMLQQQGWGDYSATLVELLGAEAMYGPHGRVQESREIVLRMAAQHPDKRALAFLQKESASAGTSMGPGTRSHFGGRAEVQGVIRAASYYMAKAQVPVMLQLDDAPPRPVDAYHPGAAGAAPAGRRPEPELTLADSAGQVWVPLSLLAHARSGDKGNDANIGVVARRPEWVPVLARALTAERVRAYFAHLMTGAVTRYALPGIGAFNFFLEQSLGGGGSCSLRSDPLGKCYAQMLLDMTLPCPQELLPASGPTDAATPLPAAARA